MIIEQHTRDTVLDALQEVAPLVHFSRRTDKSDVVDGNVQQH